MSSLYNIAQDYIAVIEGGMVFDTDTGEILFDSENIDALEVRLEDKLEACAMYIKNLNADVEALKVEEKNLAERRKAKEKQVESLKKYMGEPLELVGGKLDTPKAALSTRKSEVVEVLDESILPEQFKTVKTTTTPNKVAIKKALKAGEDVPGAVVIVKNNLQVK